MEIVNQEKVWMKKIYKQLNLSFKLKIWHIKQEGTSSEDKKIIGSLKNQISTREEERKKKYWKEKTFEKQQKYKTQNEHIIKLLKSIYLYTFVIDKKKKHIW